MDDDDNIIDLTTEYGEKYKFLFGGFEDLNSFLFKTPAKTSWKMFTDEMIFLAGYLKDGFVVGTDSDKDENSVDEDYEDFFVR